MAKAKKPIPFEFVLEALDELSPRTNPMFGCQAVYVGEKIVLILRERESSPQDNGVWLATTEEHHASLKPEFPSMRSIEVFGPGPTGWQVLPSDADDFEEAVLKACDLVRAGDPRIGKIPKSKLGKSRTRSKTEKLPAKAKPKAAKKKTPARGPAKKRKTKRKA